MEMVSALIGPLGFESLVLMMLAPVFLACIAWEALYWHGRRPVYSWRDTLGNAALALSHQIVDAAAWMGLIGLFWLAYEFRLFDIPTTAWSVALLFLLQDFCYYWFHRASHRIRWLWASHVVHHSSQRLNLSTAFRQSLMYPVSGMWVFWLPLVLLGFRPEQVLLVVAINLAYQFFVHTEAVQKLGWLEWVFNTPSHHRVHHARNEKYIDRNYGGVLIIWDRLFGTFVAEDPAEPCEYGIVRQIETDNLLVMIFHEWVDMFRDAARPGPLWQRLQHFWRPPEWQREQARAAAEGQG